MAEVRLDEAPKYLWPYMLRAVMEAVGSQNAAPLCLNKLADILNHPRTRHTYGGCLITFTKSSVHIQREWPRIPDVAVTAPGAMLWDDRFFIKFSATAPQGHLRALGRAKHFAHLPYHLKGYPGLFHGGGVTPFWETSVFRNYRLIQETRFPQTQRILQRGA